MNYGIETFSQSWVSLESLLWTARSFNISLGSGARRTRKGLTFLFSSWFNIRTSSSKTRVAHLRAGSSIRLICCLIITSNAVVPTKRAGEDPYKSKKTVSNPHQKERRRKKEKRTEELYKIVLISASLT